MGLKHLQGAVWAVCLASASAAFAQEGNPEGCVWDPDNLTLTCPYMLTLEQFCQDNPSHEACVWYDLGENVALVIDDEGGGSGGDDDGGGGGDDDGGEDGAEDGAEDEADYYDDIDCEEPGTACWTPGDWAGFCVGVSEFNSSADSLGLPLVDVPSQCTFYDDILLSELEDKLRELAQEYPATTCATAVAATTGAILVYAKIKRAPSAGASWAWISAVSISCAYVMEVSV